MAQPPIIDATFTVVGEPAPKKPSLLIRFGWWCVGVVVTTAFAGVFAFVVAVIVIFGLGITDDEHLGWAATVVTLVVLGFGSLLRGFLRPR